MLAQLKTFVLIKEAIKLAFFRLVEYLEHQHLWVQLQVQNGQKQITFFWIISLFLFWLLKAIPCEKFPRNWRSHTTLCTTPFSEQCKLSLTRIERGMNGRPRCTNEQGDKYIRVSSLRNRRVTSPQLPASLNSTRKNTSLNFNSEEATSWCWPSRQSCKEKAISQTGQ